MRITRMCAHSRPAVTHDGYLTCGCCGAEAQGAGGGISARPQGILKRDLICVKRDLICVKRDVMCVKRDLIQPAQVPGAHTTALAEGFRAPNECWQGLSMIKKEEAAAWAEAPCCYHRIRCGGQKEEGGRERRGGKE